MRNINPFHIAQHEQVSKRVAELSRRSDDIKSRLACTLKKLWLSERELAIVTNLEVFNDLKSKFPNFIEVIELYEANAIGLSKMGLPFEAPPILLQGEPGLGKTLFASELARLVELPFFEISMATMTASFALSGGSLQWGEGTVGFIANSIADSTVGNPFFLIDEVDKSGHENRYNPLNPFYSLLETHSAKRFRDEALDIDIDASRVIWMATANYIQNVPQPILSRMRTIEIKRPNAEQMINVVVSIYSNFRQSKAYGQLLDPNINEDTMDILRTKSPREAKLSIDEGCLKAIRAGRSTLLPQDLPATKKEIYHVGFI
ncbi:MAG: AAA family ATPase [Methylotenera sp.]